MASPANFQVARSFGVGVHTAKIDFGKLYMRQVFDKNQSDLLKADPITMLGQTAVNNWEIYDGLGSGANLVAYGRGIHTYAGDWENFFTMVFEIQRFKGSTLQIMGASIGKSSEWAIVGGTGDFAMAQGVVRRKEHTKTSNEAMEELTIDGYCRMNLPPVPTPTKMGPWGVSGGDIRNIDGKSARLESVTIQYKHSVYTIEFSYYNEDGQIRTGGRWGHPTPYNSAPERVLPPAIIKFGPSEFVKEMTGIALTSKYIADLKIITNIATYGPFGDWTGGTRFQATVPDDKTVVGLFVHTDDRAINKIGFETI